MNFIIGSIIVCFVIPQTYQGKDSKQKNASVVERILDRKDIKEATSRDFQNADGEPLMVRGIINAIDTYPIYNRNEDGSYSQSERTELTVESEVIKRFKVSSESCALVKDKDLITKVEVKAKKNNKKEVEYDYIAFDGDEVPQKVTKEVLEKSEKIKKEYGLTEDKISQKEKLSGNEIEIIGADGKKYLVNKSLFDESKSFRNVKKKKEQETKKIDEVVTEPIKEKEEKPVAKNDDELVEQGNYDITALLEKQIKEEKIKEEKIKEGSVNTKEEIKAPVVLKEEIQQNKKSDIKELKEYNSLINEAVDIMLHKD